MKGRNRALGSVLHCRCKLTSCLKILLLCLSRHDRPRAKTNPPFAKLLSGSCHSKETSSRYAWVLTKARSQSFHKLPLNFTFLLVASKENYLKARSGPLSEGWTWLLGQGWRSWSARTLCPVHLQIALCPLLQSVGPLSFPGSRLTLFPCPPQSRAKNMTEAIG